MPLSTVGLLAPGMAKTRVNARFMSSPYFVILSTIEPRKNHMMLLQVWRKLIEKLGDAAPRLVVIGQRGWECENVVNILERCTVLKGFVIELNNCSDQDVVNYLHHSQALLFPSFAEGYGMPLIEALALGVPVIASDLPVFKEIVADIPDYVDPLDAKRWGELIAEYTLNNSVCRTAQLSRMKKFTSPGWADHFAQVDAMLGQLDNDEQQSKTVKNGRGEDATQRNDIKVPESLYAYQFSCRKRPVIKQCFPGSNIHFIERADALPAGSTLLLWGMGNVPEGVDDNVQVLRIEDGFLRSEGLEADSAHPVSWVVDKRGIYFDATRLSGLEELLASEDVDNALIIRSAKLRARIEAAGLMNCNVGADRWRRPDGAHRVILVPGQVETEASLTYGAPGERTNMGLLKAVRAANPDAYVIYQPHPDVYAGLRGEEQNAHDVSRWCDETVITSRMDELLRAVDEVHVLTSLTGFDALMRGKLVTCYGQPFYAGWGLTTDIIPVTRRTRRLTLDELVAGVLIKYPLYLSRNGKQLITPEQALDELVNRRARVQRNTPWSRELIRFFLRLI